MENMKDFGFGKSDKQLATIFGVSVSEMKKIKKQIALEVTKPAPKKTATKPTVKPAPMPKGPGSRGWFIYPTLRHLQPSVIKEFEDVIIDIKKEFDNG